MEAFQQFLFDELPIVGILRGFDSVSVDHIIRASVRGGLRNIEITMNSPDAEALIRSARREAGDAMNIGAGTVLNEPQLQAALNAGASFIVTPVVCEAVIAKCVALSVPVFPGAFSPTEIARAWELGSKMVKVFPADRLGPGYIRNLKAPFPHIGLMPTGGVGLETLEDFVKAGAAALGVGSPLFSGDRVRQQDWAWIQARCEAFAEAWKKASRPVT